MKEKQNKRYRFSKLICIILTVVLLAGLIPTDMSVVTAKQKETEGIVIAPVMSKSSDESVLAKIDFNGVLKAFFKKQGTEDIIWIEYDSDTDDTENTEGEYIEYVYSEEYNSEEDSSEEDSSEEYNSEEDSSEEDSSEEDSSEKDNSEEDSSEKDNSEEDSSEENSIINYTEEIDQTVTQEAAENNDIQSILLKKLKLIIDKKNVTMSESKDEDSYVLPVDIECSIKKCDITENQNISLALKYELYMTDNKDMKLCSSGDIEDSIFEFETDKCIKGIWYLKLLEAGEYTLKIYNEKGVLAKSKFEIKKEKLSVEPGNIIGLDCFSYLLFKNQNKSYYEITAEDSDIIKIHKTDSGVKIYGLKSGNTKIDVIRKSLSPLFDDSDKMTIRVSVCKLSDINTELSIRDNYGQHIEDDNLDYRKYKDRKLQLHIDVNSPQLDSDDEDLLDLKNKTVDYSIEFDKDNAISADKVTGKTNIYKGSIDIPFEINDVGNVNISINIKGNEICEDKKIDLGRVNIVNSPINDKDYQITIRDKYNNILKNFNSENCTDIMYEWSGYLKQHNNYMFGNVEFSLTEEGKKYYDKLCTNDSKDNNKKSDFVSFNSNGNHKNYDLWMEKQGTQISTENVEGGRIKFSMSIDRHAPEIKEILLSENSFVQTSDDEKKYFGEDCELIISAVDELSGVKAVEYCVDYSMDKQNDWKKADGNYQGKYSVKLSKGHYKNIAVRAFDYSGQQSIPVIFKNAEGNPIEIIVDDGKPEISVKAFAEGESYDGGDFANDNWTNKTIEINTLVDKDSCPFAGIYRCQYMYVNAKDAIMLENDGKFELDDTYDDRWQEIKLDSGLKNALTLDKEKVDKINGYYLFRAESNCGVKSDIARIKIQQQKKLAGTAGIKISKTEDIDTGWYNIITGIPRIELEMPKYDDGSDNGEYDAPVVMNYSLSGVFMDKEDDTFDREIKQEEFSAGIKDYIMFESFLKSNDRDIFEGEGNKSVKIDLSGGEKTVKDGIYTLSYWVSDAAGNKGEVITKEFKIDMHAPENICVNVCGEPMPLENPENIVYERFYQESVAGNVSADFGISQKGVLKISQIKKTGDFSEAKPEDGDSFSIDPCTRCAIYVVAQDKAGNKSESWTNGIVVDNKAPEGISTKDIIIEPEGANHNGFFNKDVKVRISVKDIPDNDNCAALKSVVSRIGKADNETLDIEDFSFIKEYPTESEMIAASAFEIEKVIKADVNESNEAFIEVTATDRCNNLNTSKKLLKIDVTKPEIEILFDENTPSNENFYNSARTATIHIKELNFDADNVKIKATRNGNDMGIAVSEWKREGTDNYASIVFNEDGDYTLSVKCTDMADNESKEVSASDFTIDMTAPVIKTEITQVSTEADVYDNFDRIKDIFSFKSKNENLNNENPNNVSFDRMNNYFNKTVKAIITVEEHNFRESELYLKLNENHTVKDGLWSHNGDVHTYSFSMSLDGEYSIDCSFKDLAGNVSDTYTDSFVIDTQSPVISITGVENNSANAGDILPVITVTDANFEDSFTEIKLINGKGERVEISSSPVPYETENESGSSYILDDINTKPDDVYYLSVVCADKAGNGSDLEYRFSINKNGSTYDIGNVSKLYEQVYIRYDELDDICMTEMNIDKVNEMTVFASKNGNIINGVRVNSRKQANKEINKGNLAYSIEEKGSEKLGYVYSYIIYKENFQNEGIYGLSFYSKDKAGNEVNSTLESHITGKIGDNDRFVIDNTAPDILIEGVENGKIYDESKRNVNVVCSDNFKLASAKLSLVDRDGNEIQAWDYMELVKEEGEVLSVSIDECNESLSIVFEAFDAAGNEITSFTEPEVALDEFFVTTNKLVQIANLKEKHSGIRVIYIYMSAAVVIIGVAVIMIRRRRKSIRL